MFEEGFFVRLSENQIFHLMVLTNQEIKALLIVNPRAKAEKDALYEFDLALYAELARTLRPELEGDLY